MNELNQFLKKGWKEAVMFSLESEIFRIASVPIADPPTVHILLFREIEHLRKERSGKISIAKGEMPVMVEFSLDYLQGGDVRATVLDATLLRPDTDLYHPDLDAMNGIISLGRIFPATPFSKLIRRVYRVLTYQRLNMKEGSAANPAASSYLSNHTEMVCRFRVSPLIRRRFRRGGVERDRSEMKGT